MYIKELTLYLLYYILINDSKLCSITNHRPVSATLLFTIHSHPKYPQFDIKQKVIKGCQGRYQLSNPYIYYSLSSILAMRDKGLSSSLCYKDWTWPSLKKKPVPLTNYSSFSIPSKNIQPIPTSCPTFLTSFPSSPNNPKPTTGYRFYSPAPKLHSLSKFLFPSHYTYPINSTTQKEVLLN